jgi:ParB-like chromosome segregation protein Spo0J
MFLTIPLDRLIPHPGNANAMPKALFRKLCAHLRRTGNYPPLIVRRHPDPARQESYEILDGHHRARALGEIGVKDARCDVWQVDDREALILLITLNRLEGSDDPRRRAHLLDELRELDSLLIDPRELAKLAPEDANALERLKELMKPPALLDDPAALDPERALEPVTFFLTRRQRSRLLARLASVCPDRTHALLRLLGLEEVSKGPQIHTSSSNSSKSCA